MDDKIIPVSEPLNLAPLDERTRKIAQSILDEQDVEKVKDLTNLFNLNAQKRNVARVIRMNDLLDKVTEQIMERFEKTPHNFSNDDLIKYMQAAEGTIDRANKSLHLVDDTPPIQLMQNNQLNINIDSGLDRDSRERVMDAVRALLSQASTSPTEAEDEGDG